MNKTLRSTGEPLALTSVESTVPSSAGEDLDTVFLRTRHPPTVPTTGTPITAIDLFCGVGGLTLGVMEAAVRAGRPFHPMLACDFATSPLAVYDANFGTGITRNVDLAQVSSLIGSPPTPLELRLLTPLVGAELDFLLAGPPCQGHSNLNNHTRRSDPKNELYLKVARVAEYMRPRFVLIENVPGVERDHGDVVARTADALSTLGYRVDRGIVDLCLLGVPQTRKRHLLAAVRTDVKSPFHTIRETVRQARVAPRSLRWAIEDLMSAFGTGLMHEAGGMTDVTRARVNYLFDNDLYELPDANRPDCHRNKPHTYGSVYGRMSWDKPSPTLTSGFVTMGRGRFIHPARRTTLTPREAARVQFFPDYFDFGSLSTKKALAEAIGNAVPPKMSMVFASAMLAGGSR